MTKPDFEPLPSGHPLFARRGVLLLFQKATLDVVRHGAPFFLALLVPVALIYGGTYAALLAALNVERSSGLLLVVLLGCLALFTGFWQFIVRLAGFNRSYADVLAARPASCGQACRALLKAHQSKLIWYINGLIVVQVIAALVAWFVTLPLMFFLPEGVVGLVVQVLVYLPYALVSMGFQILALGNPDQGPLGVLRQSANLVKTRFWVCFFVLLACFVLTYYLIPGVVVVLAEMSGLVSWFNQFHEPSIHGYLLLLRELKGQTPGVMQAMLGQVSLFGKDLHGVSRDLSHQLSQTLLTSLVNSLLLPWGTFVYALLYGDMIAKARETEGDSSFSG